MHLKDSRFESTSNVFKFRHFKLNSNHVCNDEKECASSRKLPHSPSVSTSSKNLKEDISSNHSHKFLPTLETKFINHFSSNSSSLCLLPIRKEETPPHHNSKKILGTSKPLDLSSHKIILGKTSGFNKTFSLSYLGTSIFRKSKVKSEKYSKSFSKTRSSKSRPNYSSSSASSENRSSSSLELAYGEQSLFISSIVVLIILILLYLFALKLLHRPFDRGKEHIVITTF